MYKEWLDLLQDEGIPLNSTLVFHCQNEGVCRVVYKGKQIPLSKDARQFAWRYVVENRQESFMVGTPRLGGYDWKRAVTISLCFVHGKPPGHPAFGGRKDRKRILKSVWGNTEHWKDNK